MDVALRAGLVGRDRRRAVAGLAVAVALAAGVFAIGARQVPTTPVEYDAKGIPLYAEPAIASPVWIAGIAVSAAIVAMAYAYWNGGLLVAVAITTAALLPPVVFADLVDWGVGLASIDWGRLLWAPTLDRNVAIALAVGTLAYAVGNEARLYATGHREPLRRGALVGDDPDLAGTQVAVATAIGTLPLLAMLVVPYLPTRYTNTAAFGVIAVGLLPVAFGGVVAMRRSAVVVPLVLAAVLGASVLLSWVYLLVLPLFLVVTLATAEAARRHGALAPSLAAPAIPLFLYGVALMSPPISGCRWMQPPQSTFGCSTGPVDLLVTGTTAGAIGLAIGLIGFLLGVGVRRVAPG